MTSSTPCQDPTVDPNLFFADDRASVLAAQALCRDCPIRDLCLTAARQRREEVGVWGGELFVNGRPAPTPTAQTTLVAVEDVEHYVAPPAPAKVRKTYTRRAKPAVQIDLFDTAI